jgi:TolB-like protein
VRRTEELIHALSQDEHLQVVARTSVFAFKGKQEDVRSIGAQLDAGTVVEGSIRAAGDQLRITAQLIRVDDGYHLWSACYDRTIEDVLALETEIAQEIGSAVETRIYRAP